jgi:FAD/FMN-containing dehydrogenase
MSTPSNTHQHTQIPTQVDQEQVLGMLAELPDVPTSVDPERVKRASRDMSAVLSPGLARLFADRLANAIASPRDEAELMQVIAAAAAHRVPLIPRGAGTCNFGQSVPLRGGVVLEVGALKGMVAIEDGRWRSWTGSILADIDRALEPTGQELRLYPSSKAVGTAGGYVIGGHAGVGAIRHGVLADTGNILGLRVITVEETPQILEIRGPDVDLVHFSFGTAGIVSQVEMPTAPLRPWRDLALSFPTLEAAAEFGLAMALADGVDVKNVHPVDESIAGALTPLALPAGRAGALVMAAPYAVETVLQIAGPQAELIHDVPLGTGPRKIPFYEYTWGHSVFWLRKQRPSIATLIALLPEQEPIAALEKLKTRLPEGTCIAISIKRFSGRPAMQLALCVPDDSYLVAVSEEAAALGCLVADTHRPVLSATSIYEFDHRKQALKERVDPYGLLNPGKLGGLDASAEDDAHSGGLGSAGFTARR